VTNTQPKATGEDLEAQGTVATKHFPSRMYAVYVHVSCIQHSQHVHGRQPYLHRSDSRGNIEEMMHRKIRLYLGKIQLYLHRESASRVTGESAVAPAVTVLDRPSPTCPYRDRTHARTGTRNGRHTRHSPGAKWGVARAGEGALRPSLHVKWAIFPFRGCPQGPRPPA
jgi:hypothetical protein